MLKLKEKKVRELIGHTGLSVRAWGMEHGFPQGTLSNWVNGSRNISKSQLIKLADALHVEDLTEISMIVFHINQRKIDQIENEISEIRDLWGFLPPDQRSSILNLIRSMAEPDVDSYSPDEPENKTKGEKV